MTDNVQCCSRETSLTEVARIMSQLNCGFVPVCEGKKVVGVITDRDIVLRAVAKGKDVSGTRASECMTQPVIHCTSDTDAHEAARLMANKQIRRIPIVDNDQLVGVVALGDMATINIHANEAGQALSKISVPAEPGAH